jgi:hypothetical protein
MAGPRAAQAFAAVAPIWTGFYAVGDKKPGASAGLSLFRRSGSLFLLQLADRLVSAGLVAALVLLRIA